MNYIFNTLINRYLINRTIYVVKANNIPPHNESIKTVNTDQSLNKAQLVVSNTA